MNSCRVYESERLFYRVDASPRLARLCILSSIMQDYLHSQPLLCVARPPCRDTSHCRKPNHSVPCMRESPRAIKHNHCFASSPFASACKTVGLSGKDYSSSTNSTMTVPCFRLASAMLASSWSIRFLPKLMSSNGWPSWPSTGLAFNHS